MKAGVTVKGAKVRYSIETVFEVTDEAGRWCDEADITPEAARAIVDEFRESRTLGAA